MAGAPILVVDDSPVSLKLLRLLLTYEGYEVRTSERAEEALRMLESFRPALVLTDIHMPDMDGIEMIRRIKSDRRTSAIKVAALTVSTSRVDNERALEAGCESYIIKSEDTATLAARVRGLLGEKAPPQRAVEADPAARRLPAPAEASLRRGFLEDAAQCCGVMLKRLDTRLDSIGIAAQLREWADGAVQFPAITRLARHGEELLAEFPLRTTALRECLSDLYFAFEDLLAGETAPPPDFILQALRDKRIALVGLPAKHYDGICAKLGRVGSRPMLFSADDDPDSASIRDCDFIVLHVYAGMSAARLEILAANAGKLLLAGERRELFQVAAALPLAAAEFLVESWEPDEVLLRLALAGARSEAARAKPAASPAPSVRPRDSVASPSVVLADDDPIVLAILRSTLTNYGMRVQTAGNGRDALRLVREIRPHMAVLDIDMPEANGYECLAAMRADNIAIPVVMLSARQQESDILRGFQLGADDYLVKPFNPMELVARLKRLLRQEVPVQ